MEKIEEKIQTTFIYQKWKLSIAESCTGGALAARITQIPGCSQYFLGSLVAYSNELKINVLEVDSDLLEQKGAVSAEVVAQMAEGILRLTGSDYSLAVSGIAGPQGGSVEKPVGTIYAAIVRKGEEPYIWSFFLKGQRCDIIENTVEQVLNQLLKLIKNKITTRSNE